MVYNIKLSNNHSDHHSTTAPTANSDIHPKSSAATKLTEPFPPKMKLPIVFTVVVAVALLVPGSLAGPISVKDNNIGDIVTIGVNLQADIKTDIDTTIVNVLVALLTQVGNVGGLEGLPSLPQQEAGQPEEGPVAVAPVEPEAPITMPKADLMKTIQSLKGLAQLSEQSNEETEKIFNQHAKEFIQRLLQKN